MVPHFNRLYLGHYWRYPKGVVYSHRGAYLNALADITHSGLYDDSSYLWTLSMFHCNGWCYTWATIEATARNVVISKIEPERIWQIIQDHSISHLCGTPTVLVSLASVSELDQEKHQT